eukprot:1376111-Pleurochrysis_carterae.AAC.1
MWVRVQISVSARKFQETLQRRRAESEVQRRMSGRPAKRVCGVQCSCGSGAFGSGNEGAARASHTLCAAHFGRSAWKLPAGSSR